MPYDKRVEYPMCFYILKSIQHSYYDCQTGSHHTNTCIIHEVLGFMKMFWQHLRIQNNQTPLVAMSPQNSCKFALWSCIQLCPYNSHVKSSNHRTQLIFMIVICVIHQALNMIPSHKLFYLMLYTGKRLVSYWMQTPGNLKNWSKLVQMISSDAVKR